MPASPLSGAQEARKAIADRLGGIRRDAELSGLQLAQLCGWHPSNSSRIENARAVPSDADIRAWCAACGVPDRAADLIAASRCMSGPGSCRCTAPQSKLWPMGRHGTGRDQHIRQGVSGRGRMDQMVKATTRRCLVCDGVKMGWRDGRWSVALSVFPVPPVVGAGE
ncbi:helix-turn-helix domain-containing protein [Streptacidiphilus sp. N1-12]|uniref:Helix-turn-helix domain-containing protein n=2 Tax=Streptacidiphilus alkalitolerans TaxID=3342712 RepID=A0ABV6WRC1_9ACTN